MKPKSGIMIPVERITERIYLIRGMRVMLDQDLTSLYEVETKALKQAVRRNIERFPEDFMLALSKDEFDHLRPQIVTSSWGGTRYTPMAFTEQKRTTGTFVLNVKIDSRRCRIHV